MNIRDYSSQFCISFFSQDVDLGAQVKHALALASYENYYFSDIDEQLHKMQDSPPHVVIFDVRSSLLQPHEFIQKALNVSSEIKFIFIAPSEQISAFKNYSKYNVCGVFSSSEKAIDYQIIQTIDLICETIFRTYQNEQITEDRNILSQNLQDLQNTLNEERKAPKVRPYQTRIAEYKSTKSKEELLNAFYRQTPTQSWIYVKFVATIDTFLCVSYAETPDEWVEGLSYKIKAHDKDNFLSQLYLGTLPYDFEQYLKKKFGTDSIKFLPMIVRDKLEGVLISAQDISAEVAEDFSLMSLMYTLFVLEAEPKQLEIEDPLTGFYNHVFYSKVIERELDRSKRGLVPLSLIKISIDKFQELETSLGREKADKIILDVARVIKETSRLNDYLCRTNENEFSLILTNCNRKGAALRAERFRQMLHKENFLYAGVKITTSQGISEYPTLTANEIDLESSAQKAMHFISQKGGDKICISKAPALHKADFMVDA